MRSCCARTEAAGSGGRTAASVLDSPRVSGEYRADGRGLSSARNGTKDSLPATTPGRSTRHQLDDTKGWADDDPGDRAEDGSRAEPPHVPPDGEDSRLRGTGERALQEREDAGPRPSLRG